MGKGCHSKIGPKDGLNGFEDNLSKYTFEAYPIKVEDFSSEYARENSACYSVRNLAGESSIFPRYGDFTQACVLRSYGRWWLIAPSLPDRYVRPDPDDFCSHDYVDVVFETPVYPIRVNVLETYHPGAVVRILAYCQKLDNDSEKAARNRWITLWSGGPEQAPQESRIFSPPIIAVYEPVILATDFPEPVYVISFSPADRMFRLEFNSSLCGYYPEIDAIHVLGIRVTDTTIDMMERARSNNNETNNEDDLEESLDHAIRQMDLLDDDDVIDSWDGCFTPVLGEIIEKIFSYLDLRSLCRAAATCRLFRRYAYDSLQYREVNLQPFWTRVNDETLENLDERCNHLRKLSLSWCGNYGLITPANFDKFVISTCSGLTSLSVACCKFVTEAQLEVISRTCTHLRELDLQSCRSIKSHGFIHLSNIGLRHLNLYRTTIETGTLVSVIKTNTELEHLNMGSCINLVQDDVAVALSRSTPNLKSLDMWRAQALSDVGVNALADGCRKLEELDIGWCSDVRSESGCVLNLVTRCSNMKKLVFTANRTICDNDLDAIARCCPLLEQLDILGTSQVTPQYAQRILDRCKKLKMFDVSFCSGITFAIYQDWLKAYSHVDIKKSFVDT